MLQVLFVITMDITIVSVLMVNFRNYWCGMLMDDMVDCLVMMESLFRHLMNSSQVALIIIPVSIRV